MEHKWFRKSYPFICDECGEFLHTEYEICEICGAPALRKATKADYIEHDHGRRKEAKNLIWLIPLAAGILGIIAIATPSATLNFLSLSYSIWLFGFSFIEATGFLFIIDTIFQAFPILILFSLIAFVLILIAVAKLLNSALSIKRGQEEKDFSKKCIIGGILLIVAPIIFIIGGVTVDIGGVFGFWNLFDIGIGLIFSFISGGLGIIGGYILARPGLAELQ